MRVLRVALLLFVVVPLCIGHAAAEPAEGRVEHHGAADLDGDLDLDADAAAFWREPTAKGTWSATLRLGAATAHLVNVPTQETRVLDPTTGQMLGGSTRLEERPLWTRPAHDLTAAGGADLSGLLRVLPAGGEPATARLELDSATWGPAQVAPHLPEDPNLPFTPTVAGLATRPTGTYATLTTPHWPPVTLPGSQVVLVAADGVWLDGEPVRTGRSLNQTESHFDPVTGSGRYVFDNLVLVLTARDVEVRVAGDPGWAVAARAAHGILEGNLTWRDVDAVARLGDQDAPRHGDLVTVGGTIVFDARVGPRGTVWTFQGDLDRVLWDLQAILDVPLAGAVLGLLALLLAAGLGRGLITFVAGRSTPKLVKAPALGSRTRRHLLRIIHEHQPIRQVDLVARSGASRTNVAYHLRILSAHDILQTAPTGNPRSVAYELNSGSLMYHAQGVGRFLGEPSDAAGLLRPGEALAVAHGHPLRRAIFDAILAQGPVDFQGIHDHVAASGAHRALPQSTATHHLKLLETANVVRSRREGGRKRYVANVDPDRARVEQYRRYLDHHGLSHLMSALARDGPCTAGHLADATGRGTRTVHRILRDLVGLGLVDHGPGGGYVVSSVLPRGVVDE